MQKVEGSSPFSRFVLPFPAVRIALAGVREGRVEACEPRWHLLLTMRDPEARPGQPEHTAIDARLTSEGAGARSSGRSGHGREPRDAESRWTELVPAYQALGVI